MRITKFGHSCFLVEEEHVRILFDPGTWSEDVGGLTNVDALFLSHEHPDHTDPAQIKSVVAANPQIKIFTNPGVGKILTDNNISWIEFVHGQTQNINGVMVEAIGEKHAEIYPSIPAGQVHNIGFLIDGRLWYPGDSLTEPKRPVEILALPVCAPWLKMAEALDYAQSINPKVCFPVHDGMLKHTGSFHRLPKAVLEPLGIQFLIPEVGVSFDMS